MENQKKIIILAIGIAIFIIIALNIIFVLVSRQTKSTEIKVNPTPFDTSQLKITVSPTTKAFSISPLKELKNQLTDPVIHQDITIEYRKHSNSWIVFYNGDKEAAVLTLTSFFQAHLVDDYSSEDIQYIPLDVTIAPNRKRPE